MIIHISHFVKKACTQKLIFNKINKFYCIFKDNQVKVSFNFFFFYSKFMMMKNIMILVCFGAIALFWTNSPASFSTIAVLPSMKISHWKRYREKIICHGITIKIILTLWTLWKCYRKTWEFPNHLLRNDAVLKQNSKNILVPKGQSNMRSPQLSLRMANLINIFFYC